MSPINSTICKGLFTRRDGSLNKRVNCSSKGKDSLFYKQLLGEVFVISRIIKVSVKVISLSLRLRLITLTETLIILDITKTECNIVVLLYIERFK